MEQTKPVSQPKPSAPGPIEYLRSIYTLLTSPYTPPDLKSAIRGSFATMGGLAMITSAVDTEGVRGSWLVEYINEAKISDEDAIKLLRVHLSKARQSLGNDREGGWLMELINMVIGSEGKGKAT